MAKKLMAFRLEFFAASALEKAAVEGGSTKTEVVERAIPLYLGLLLYAKGDEGGLHTLANLLKIGKSAENVEKKRAKEA